MPKTRFNFYQAIFLAAGLVISPSTWAQIGIPSTALNKPVEHCFDQFQRLTTTQWDEVEQKNMLYMTYTYHLLLDQETHIDEEGDIFVFYPMGDALWFLDLRTMEWIGIRNGSRQNPPTFFSGKLAPLTKVAIRLPAEAAAVWELSKNSPDIFIGYGLRESSISTAYDSAGQMTSQLREGEQYHLIRSTYGYFIPESTICLGVQEIRYLNPPAKPSPPID